MAITKEQAQKAMETMQMVVPEKFALLDGIKWVEGTKSKCLGVPILIDRISEDGLSVLLANLIRWPLSALTLHESSAHMPTEQIEQPYKRELSEAEKEFVGTMLISVTNGNSGVWERGYSSGYRTGYADRMSSLPSSEEIKAKDEAIEKLRLTIEEIETDISLLLIHTPSGDGYNILNNYKIKLLSALESTKQY